MAKWGYIDHGKSKCGKELYNLSKVNLKLRVWHCDCGFGPPPHRGIFLLVQNIGSGTNEHERTAFSGALLGAGRHPRFTEYGVALHSLYAA